MHYLYIIYSKSKNRFYIGETINPSARLVKHNNHTYKMGFTKIACDWEMVLSFRCNDKSEAVYLEKFIKKMKSIKFIQKIISDQSILQDLLLNR